MNTVQVQDQWENIQWIPLSDIGVLEGDNRYERSVTERRAKRIADGFDPELFGTIIVAPRDGAILDKLIEPIVPGTSPGSVKYLLIDGGHRCTAMVLLGWTDQTVPAVVLMNADVARQAHLFIGHNKERKAIHPITMYRAAVVAGHEAETAVDSIVTSLGLRVVNGRAVNAVQACGAMVRIRQFTGDENLRRTLLILRNAWHGEVGSLDGFLIETVAWLTNRYGARIEDKRLTEVLARENPTRLVSESRLAAKQVRASNKEGRAVTHLAEVMLHLYNARRKNQLRWLPPESDRGRWLPIPANVDVQS